MRWLAACGVGIALTLAAVGSVGAAGYPPPPDEQASCLGVASAFYADFAVGQRASVAHLVKEIAGYTDDPAGERYSEFAQESPPYPCTGLE
jgi:hypothetical protein